MSNSANSFDRYPYLKHSTAKQECCGNPLRGCMDCPPPKKLTFEEWVVSQGYAYFYAPRKMQWSAGTRLLEKECREIWQAAQENKE